MKELGGSAGVGVPDSVTLEKIQHRWTSMHESYSPNKKVQSLLKVCKSIYHSMSANATSGEQAFFWFSSLFSGFVCVVYKSKLSFRA